MNFVPFYIPSLRIWIYGLFFFWLSGQICIKFLKRQNFVTSTQIHNKLPHIVFLICILVTVLRFNGLGDLDFGSKEMGEEIGMGGIAGRIANLLLICFPFIISIRLSHVFKIIISAILIVFLLSLGSKTWLMNGILAAIICLLFRNKIKLTFKSIGITAFILFACFYIYYSLNVNIDDSSDLTNFILRHFYFYLTSGILPMGEYCRLGSNGFDTNFSIPFLNIIALKLGFGNEVGHSQLTFITDLIHDRESNVFTFFGTLYISQSALGFIAYCILLGIWVYSVYFWANNKKNIFLQILSAYNLSILFFSWFNCGFGLLRIWEIALYCIVFYNISKYKMVIKN